MVGCDLLSIRLSLQEADEALGFFPVPVATDSSEGRLLRERSRRSTSRQGTTRGDVSPSAVQHPTGSVRRDSRTRVNLYLKESWDGSDHDEAIAVPMGDEEMHLAVEALCR